MGIALLVFYLVCVIWSIFMSLSILHLHSDIKTEERRMFPEEVRAVWPMVNITESPVSSGAPVFLNCGETVFVGAFQRGRTHRQLFCNHSQFDCWPIHSFENLIVWSFNEHNIGQELWCPQNLKSLWGEKSITEQLLDLHKWKPKFWLKAHGSIFPNLTIRLSDKLNWRDQLQHGINLMEHKMPQIMMKE